MSAWWVVITRHPNHQPGRWTHDGAVYETRSAAIAAARELWDGTPVSWRLMTIPVDDEHSAQPFATDEEISQ